MDAEMGAEEPEPEQGQCGRDDEVLERAVDAEQIQADPAADAEHPGDRDGHASRVGRSPRMWTRTPPAATRASAWTCCTP